MLALDLEDGSIDAVVDKVGAVCAIKPIAETRLLLGAGGMGQRPLCVLEIVVLFQGVVASVVAFFFFLAFHSIPVCGVTCRKGVMSVIPFFQPLRL